MTVTDSAHRGTVRLRSPGLGSGAPAASGAAPRSGLRAQRFVVGAERRISNKPNAYDSLLMRAAGVCERRRPGVRRPSGVTLEPSTPADGGSGFTTSTR